MTTLATVVVRPGQPAALSVSNRPCSAPAERAAVRYSSAMPAAASAALAPMFDRRATLVVESSSRRAVVLAPLTRGAPQAATDHDRMVIVSAPAVHHPAAVVVPQDTAWYWQRGQTVQLENDTIIGPGCQLAVRRWWQPQLRPAALHPPAMLIRRGSRLCDELEVMAWPGLDDHERQLLVDRTRRLERALRAGVGAESNSCPDAAGAHRAVAAAVARLVGLGPGTTPLGDDVLAGVLAGHAIFATRARLDWLWSAVRSRLRGNGTTGLSACLLRHAADGSITLEARGLLNWLAGSDDGEADAVTPSLTPLRGVGASSGWGLAYGLAMAAVVAARTVRG